MMVTQEENCHSASGAELTTLLKTISTLYALILDLRRRHAMFLTGDAVWAAVFFGFVSAGITVLVWI
jgi:hypothetical protein